MGFFITSHWTQVVCASFLIFPVHNALIAKRVTAVESVRDLLFDFGRVKLVAGFAGYAFKVGRLVRT